MSALMHKPLMLSSKEGLVDRVLELQADNERLQEENQRLRKELEKLQERLNRPVKDSPNSSKAPSTDQKASRVKRPEGEGLKKGPPFGHVGVSRQKRAADLIRILTIDILRQKTTCPGCQRAVVAPHPEGIEKNRAFGLRLEALVGRRPEQHNQPMPDPGVRPSLAAGGYFQSVLDKCCAPVNWPELGGLARAGHPGFGVKTEKLSDASVRTWLILLTWQIK